MLPMLDLFGRNVAMYGLLILIGILFGISLALIRRRTYNYNAEDILFASCYAGIGSIIGAKVLYLLTILPTFIKYFNQIITNKHLLLSMLTGGFVFYGGLIGAVIGFYLYCKQFRIDFPPFLDFLIPSIPLIHSFGRIGCFFAGCCYGIPYDGPLHIIFHQSIGAPNNVPLFPIQLMEALFNLIISILLLYLSKKIKRPGQLLGSYLISYSILRFVLEFFRGDIDRGNYFGITTSQWISIALIPIGLYSYFCLSRLMSNVSNPKTHDESGNNK